MTDVFSKLAAAGPNDEIEESRQLWVLGGRGVQDVIFMKGAPLDEYGTTIRCYDADLDVWYVTVMQPAGQDISSDGFRWRGESFRDDGSTWRLDQEMTATCGPS